MSNTIAIMQPTYLSWTGYIALAIKVDQFVYLDTVQFSRRSWQQRNRIKTSNGEMLLTVPVVKGPRDQKIFDVQIHKSAEFPNKHIEALEHSYSKAEFFDEYSQGLINILHDENTSLVELNIRILDWVFDILEIKTRTVRSSSLNVNGNKDELLAKICSELSATHYLSPVGSNNYLDSSSYFGEKGLSYGYLDYEPAEYKQLYGTFIPSLSIIDLIFNEGRGSREIIEKGISNE